MSMDTEHMLQVRVRPQWHGITGFPGAFPPPSRHGSTNLNTTLSSELILSLHCVLGSGSPICLHPGS